MTRRLSFLGQAVAYLAAASAVGASAPAGAEAWQPGEDDALILELHSGAYKLGDTLRGYQTPAGVCVDMADVIQALDLPVRLDKKSRRATGWLFEERERFTLDREANTVQTVNGNFSLARSAVIDTPEGWCADTRALSGWFGVTFRPELGNLRVVLETPRKLPFLQAIERRSRAARLRHGANSFDLSALPQQATPYKSWRTPSVDVLVSAAWKGGGGQNARELQYEAYASGEALGISYDARLASDITGVPASLRLRAYRNDPTGNLLGPLKATRVAVGDVETFAGALTGQSAVGRGMFISNRPLNRPSRFGITEVRGELPSGWDAELYRNGQLYAFQADRGDGRYNFDNVELLFGENSLEVVLYGPQGQIRRDRQDIPVGTESIPTGKTWYWAGIIQQDHELIDFSRRFVAPQTGWRWGVGVERGIDQRTVAGIEAQSLVLSGKRHSYLEARLQRAVGPMLVELSGAQEFGGAKGSGGRALRVQALGKIGRINFQAETLWIDGGYESEAITRNDRRQYGLRLDSELKFGKLSLPVQAALRQTLTRDGTKVTEWLTRGSLMMRGLSLTAELNDKRSSGPRAVTDDDGMRLGVLANGSIGKVRLRGDARFRLSGARHGFESAQLVAETHLGGRSDLRAGAEYIAANHRTDFTLGYVRQFERFALRAEGTVGTRGNVGAGLSLAFSLGPDPLDGGWRFSGEKLAQNGQAAVTVFRDENGDGVRQPGEEPIEGISVEAGFGGNDQLTNKAGHAMLGGLRPFAPVLVKVNTDALPDPLLQPKGRGVVIVPRPGVAADIVLALTPTGEVEGSLLGIDGSPREGVTLELVDNHGTAIAQTSTEFDGYFLFDLVPYGQYRLRLSAVAAQLLGAKADLGAVAALDRAHTTLQLGALRLASAARPSQVATAP
ncbi:MAG TPA: carboxypeptidase-like regulatory domain-containing protein [Novosphingobium sp.]|nr:carboxypeptidase-like regulatory domain-containing protein [Novosphingobium sp.]